MPSPRRSLTTISHSEDWHRAEAKARSNLSGDESTIHGPLHCLDIHRRYNGGPMENTELDRLRQAYKDAVEAWVSAIREEVALATPDHSIHAWDLGAGWLQ